MNPSEMEFMSGGGGKLAHLVEAAGSGDAVNDLAAALEYLLLHGRCQDEEGAVDRAGLAREAFELPEGEAMPRWVEEAVDITASRWEEAARPIPERKLELLERVTVRGADGKPVTVVFKGQSVIRVEMDEDAILSAIAQIEAALASVAGAMEDVGEALHRRVEDAPELVPAIDFNLVLPSEHIQVRRKPPERHTAALKSAPPRKTWPKQRRGRGRGRHGGHGPGKGRGR